MRQTKYQLSPRFFHEAMSCSQRKVVTGNPVGKEAMVNLVCLAQLAEMPLSMPKLLSVPISSINAATPSFADPFSLVALVVAGESE
jgi:hypothetical protein